MDFIIAPLGLTVFYLGLTITLFIRRRPKSNAEKTLLIYLLALAVWNVFLALNMLFPKNGILSAIGGHVTLGGLILLSILFLQLTHAFLNRVPQRIAWWWIIGATALLIVILFHPKVISLGITPAVIGPFQIGQREVVRTFSILTWNGWKAMALIGTLRAYRPVSGPVYRNRYRYWLLSLLLLTLGDLVLATVPGKIGLLGSGIQLSSALVASQAILGYRLVDIKRLYRLAFGYMTVVLLMIGANLFMVLAAARVLPYNVFLGSLLGIGLTSTLFSFTLSPLRQGIQRFVDRHLFHIDVNHEEALRKYGERVIETLRLESLSELVAETLSSAMHANRTGLYLVQESKREIGGHRLHLIKATGDLPEGDFELHPDSVLARRLRESVIPLMQYEVDVQETFATLPDNERDMLQMLQVELLVPIHTQKKLVGLIVLGDKGTGEAYSTFEIDWLEAFAAQTAVALENALLFEQIEGMSVSVMRLNADLELAYAQLQEVDRLKSAFIGVITHEMRSPFVAAGFSVELLRRYIDKGMTEDLGKQVDQLSQELGQGRRMIDNVISFATLLSKQGKLQIEEIDVGEMLQTTLAPLEKMARSRSIHLTCHYSLSQFKIQADRTRLAEAMYHLVHNAIKFNSEGGSVRVSCWPIQSYLVFKVEDTGQGIPPHTLEHIWEVFTQAADQVRRSVEGLGLGLALVKFVVEAHSGDVWASSKRGEGSTFGFRIPINASTVQVAASPQEA